MPLVPPPPFIRIARPSRALAVIAALAGLLAGGQAQAVPSFARQTGQPCSSCHVGGFGPQLTDFGILFKLGAYTIAKPDAPVVPLSGMVVTGFTHTSASQDPAALDGHTLVGSSLKGNDNLTLDQVSLFVAGKLTSNAGVFAQLTYDGIARHVGLDNVDLRASTPLTLGEHALLVGASLNNNPGVQDPFNTAPAWSYPYISSAVAPGPSAGTILDGAFGQKATGLVGYAELDSRWYAELGTYRMQSTSLQGDFGVPAAERDPGALRSPLYARLAVRQSWGASAMHAGVTLFNTGYQPDRSLPDVTHLRDVGVDAGYRWTGAENHSATLLASLIRETQSGSSLHEYNVNASYFWGGAYEATLQRFGVQAPGLGSRGTRLQVDWTPLGDALPAASGFDPALRIGLQYTAYEKLDGLGGSAAHDANNLFLFAWLAF